MSSRRAHLSDEDLMLFADRECSSRKAACAREHLDECSACRERMKQLQETLVSFVAGHEDSVERHELPAGARTKLKARLSEAAEQSSAWQAASSNGIVIRQFAAACIACAIVAGTVWMVHSTPLRSSRSGATYQFVTALPRKALTPGATRSVSLDQLCGARSLETQPPLDASLEQKVFHEYGVPASSRQAYELDYLITPELGGATDVRNLWPEPYSSTEWNAHVKDELEDHFHDLVCQGKLPLGTAQREISEDWIAAYKRYFHTDAPLSNAANLNVPFPFRTENSRMEVSAVQAPAF
jgi:anti-sigma factor RsiW